MGYLNHIRAPFPNAVTLETLGDRNVFATEVYNQSLLSLIRRSPSLVTLDLGHSYRIGPPGVGTLVCAATKLCTMYDMRAVVIPFLWERMMNSGRPDNLTIHFNSIPATSQTVSDGTSKAACSENSTGAHGNKWHPSFPAVARYKRRFRTYHNESPVHFVKLRRRATRSGRNPASIYPIQPPNKQESRFSQYTYIEYVESTRTYARTYVPLGDQLGNPANIGSESFSAALPAQISLDAVLGTVETT
ncbi:hypothetical protein FA15DRAFT_654051 [Coprinopsis marcescibilis]|uniref:Uncharacterized protein n=1 Tax=Coprinopsis marcescibilis TaxID=230819 RepID=A0A5C3L232_COPMA|nr:hypothetical protein FA15DRAFT_654051 [Coprinopsis marcescibilis]